MKNYSTYQDLEIWKLSRSLVKKIYLITDKFPESEKFGLTNQIRRASVSIPSNIAEGYGRQYRKETIQFITVARASLNELETQLILSLDLEFITELLTQESFDLIQSLRRGINGYMKYLKNSEHLT